MRRPEEQSGFTLIELVIVCTVVGILAGIAIPNYARTKAHSTRASCISNQRNLVAAAALYSAEQGVMDGQVSSQVLYEAGYVPASLTECPDAHHADHSDYTITLTGGLITAVACSVSPDDHHWSP